MWNIGYIVDENQDILPLQSFDELKLVCKMILFTYSLRDVEITQFFKNLFKPNKTGRKVKPTILDLPAGTKNITDNFYSNDPKSSRFIEVFFSALFS